MSKNSIVGLHAPIYISAEALEDAIDKVATVIAMKQLGLEEPNVLEVIAMMVLRENGHISITK